MKIEIRNVNLYYGAQLALDNVSLNLQENMILGLLGPNGAGKSTLLKIISGLIQQDSGEVIITNKNEKINFKGFKNFFGYLPENNPLYKNLYVKEYLELVAGIRKLPYESIASVIDKVGLTREQNKKIENLSKGYKQRVGIAQAIIHEPEVLILDEPTNGLDPNQILEIRSVIKNVGEGKIVIISTHLMQEVEALCTNVALLNKGKLLANKNINEFIGERGTLEKAFQQITQS